MKKCTIISGAPSYSKEYLINNIDKSSFIIAADSGYLKLLDIGIKPNLIIGDFDSSKKPEIDCEIITLNTEKAYTDTFHCVIEAIDRGYDTIQMFCAIGNRLDHTYSNILCLDYCKKHNVSCKICDSKNRISLITDKVIIPKEYDNFSLFAYLEDCKGVKIKGAYYDAGFYNLDALDIKVSDQFAQSNYIVDDYCEITLDSGTLMIIESND